MRQERAVGEQNFVVTDPETPAPTVKKGSSRFLANVLALSGGVFVAQSVRILSAPIRSRLFEPDAFGLAAVFFAVVSLLSLGGCLMYQLVIVLPKRDEDAANVFGLCYVVVAAVGALLALVIGIWGSALLEVLGMPELKSWKWLIVPGFFFASTALPLRYWNTRHKFFKRLAAVRIESALVVALVALGLGFSGFTSGSHLILAGILGLFVTTGVLGWSFLRYDLAFVLKNCAIVGMWRMASNYKKFPLILLWSSMVIEASKRVPTVLLASFFGMGVTGLYSLAQGLIHLPMGLFSAAIAQVFFQRAGAMRASGGDLAWLLENVSKRLITIGLLPVVIVGLAGPDIFRLALGERWTEAGLYASLLTFGLLGSFLGAALSQLLIVLECQGIALVMYVAALVARVGALALGGLVFRNVTLTLLMFSLVGLLLGICQLTICTRLTNANIAAIARHFARQVLYIIPSAAIIIGTSWVLGLSQIYVVLASVSAVIPYALLVLRSDDELKGAFLKITGKMNRLTRKAGRLLAVRSRGNSSQ